MALCLTNYERRTLDICLDYLFTVPVQGPRVVAAPFIDASWL